MKPLGGKATLAAQTRIGKAAMDHEQFVRKLNRIMFPTPRPPQSDPDYDRDAEQELWVLFALEATRALAAHDDDEYGSPDQVALYADGMLAEYRKRYPIEKAAKNKEPDMRGFDHTGVTWDKLGNGGF